MDLYNIVKDQCTIKGGTVNRTINKALEHYLLYNQYKLSSIKDIMTYDEYYHRNERHAHRPSRWDW